MMELPSPQMLSTEDDSSGWQHWTLEIPSCWLSDGWRL